MSWLFWTHSPIAWKYVLELIRLSYVCWYSLSRFESGRWVALGLTGASGLVIVAGSARCFARVMRSYVSFHTAVQDLLGTCRALCERPLRYRSSLVSSSLHTVHLMLASSLTAPTVEFHVAEFAHAHFAHFSVYDCFPLSIQTKSFCSQLCRYFLILWCHQPQDDFDPVRLLFPASTKVKVDSYLRLDYMQLQNAHFDQRIQKMVVERWHQTFAGVEVTLACHL